MSPSVTLLGPDSKIVIGSDSAMVVVSDPAPVFTATRLERSPLTAPRATVNVSAPSERPSSATAIVNVSGEPSPAPKVTVPEAGVKSAASAVSPVADQATFTCLATALESVIV